MGSKIGKNCASGKGLSLPVEPCNPADHISLDIYNGKTGFAEFLSGPIEEPEGRPLED